MPVPASFRAPVSKASSACRQLGQEASRRAGFPRRSPARGRTHQRGRAPAPRASITERTSWKRGGSPTPGSHQRSANFQQQRQGSFQQPLAAAAPPPVQPAKSPPDEAQQLRQRMLLTSLDDDAQQAGLGFEPGEAEAGPAEALSFGHWEPSPHHLSAGALWSVVREEARELAGGEPSLASLLHAQVIMHPTVDRSVAFILASKLANRTLLPTQLTDLILGAYQDDPSFLEDMVADIQAVRDRDPACRNFVQPLVMFKGFQAVQSHRVAHWMWRRGRRTLALALQSRMAEVFQVDIHPAAQLGRGVLMDHATGIVIGETAVVGDNVSMLHHVTLGGSGVGRGRRHPVIGNGALLGAGSTVLGPTTVGHGSKIGAGSVVVTDIPPHTVAVGVPARVIKILDEPLQHMDAGVEYIIDYVI